jgi:hypothetical protein
MEFKQPVAESIAEQTAEPSFDDPFDGDVSSIYVKAD